MVQTSEIEELANKLCSLIGEKISPENIRINSQGRFYYTQAPAPNAPQLMYHYRGFFFVDMHSDDYNKLETGEVNSNDYIYHANWLVGYYLGGGNMIKGAFYKPLNIIENNEETKSYLTFISCKSKQNYFKYHPTQEDCKNCLLKTCPISQFKSGENEFVNDYDPRKDFYHSLKLRFENEYPGCSFTGFICDEIPDNEIWLYPNSSNPDVIPIKTFKVCVSNNVIRTLLMHEIEPQNWNDYINSFTFRISSIIKTGTVLATSEIIKNYYMSQEEPEPENNEVKSEKIKLKSIISRLFKTKK